MLLLDSGAQYEDGTTDVTRTMHFGDPTAEQKEVCTVIVIIAAPYVRSNTCIAVFFLTENELEQYQVVGSSRRSTKGSRGVLRKR